ncbi:hypothetical protein ACQPZX_20345 [Actinoplanes sp. CA-142083]|uniref:hypothetical protein n=1 Tax=Actinoplanes sp. CA-142083 TaxID=3239903 RepID=UPI003D8A775B
MISTQLRRWTSTAAAALLGATIAAVGIASPALAEPHADAKSCDVQGDVFLSDPIGAPYDNGTGASGIDSFYGTGLMLLSGSFNAVAKGRAYLKAGDYFSIDHTNQTVPASGHFQQFTTGQLAGKLGNDFTWHYCEKIKHLDDRTNTWLDRAPSDGYYETRQVIGAHMGVRLCITRPSVSDKARCVGDNGSAGWYVDNNDENTWFDSYPIPDTTGPDEPTPPSGGGSQSPNLLVMQANTGDLFTRDSGGSMHNLQLGMMRGTSPATSDGQIAFQANTSNLFTRSVGGGVHDTGYGMMAGTSPAISGGQIAFQANNTLLHTRNMNTGQTTDLRLGMMAGSSPSIAGNTSSWRIAFQANDGFLYYRDSGGATVNTGYGMMRGTSPAITKLSNGTYVTAFQANNSLLYSYINGTATDLRLGLMTDTSPSIASSGTAWTIAFQANTGSLFTRNSAGATADTGWGMMAHTSPSSRGNRIAFQANTGFLYYRDGNAMAVDTRYGMMAGTSPGA